MKAELDPRITVHTAMNVWIRSGGRVTEGGEILRPGGVEIFVEPIVVDSKTLQVEERIVAEGNFRKFPLLLPANA